MKKYIWLAILTTITMVLISCKNGVVTPDDSNAKPGRRDYTWRADTISNTFLDFISIWGDAPDNVWTAGWLMSDGLYKYDGYRWELDNRVYISDPTTIWGYGNDVWIGNDKGCIWNFKNNDYVQELKDFKVDNKLVIFYAMTGSSETDIYNVGYNGANPVIMKYDGKAWSLDKKLSDSGGFNIIKYSYRNDKYYMAMWLEDYSTRIYEYDRKELKLIYTNPPSNGGPTIAEIDGFAYIVIGHKIYRYFNGNMEFIFEVDDPSFGGVIWGRNRNDILIKMQDGLAHYNGTDWKYLFKVTEPTWLEPHSAIFDKEIFIPAKIKRTGFPIIYHGTLK